ncbi:MAG TPA: hypothetical protein PLD76_05865, partial [Paludibacteraceae bacterium]|nr:hypothetical protein [Paludibacteraceae bacterium]
MKVIYVVIALLTSLLYACAPSTENTEKYSVNEPIFMDATEFRSSIAITQDVHPITSYGKISFYKGYLFVSEPQKGIHIINNTDAKNPQVVGYIELLGNADIAIKDDILYADSYIDLVWFDISTPATPLFVGRLENVFEQALPPLEDPSFGIDGSMVWDRPSDQVIVGWTIATRTIKTSNSIFSGFPWWSSSDPTPIMAEKGST